MKYYKWFAGLTPKKVYDKQNALSLAIACELAYENKGGIFATVKTWGYTPLDFISRKKGRDIDTQCYIMANKNDVVVVFRGSEKTPDWFANFQSMQDPGPLKKTGAHEGFQDALFPAVIALTRHIDTQTNKRIWVTGHSLGGALSSLYAGMLFENSLDVYGIYTFASPRPGNAAFEQQLNKRVQGPHYRVVNDGDIVPHLPPEPFFSHPGKRIILKSRTKETTKDSWLKQRIAALKQFIKLSGQPFDITDNHRLAAYDRSYIPRLIKDLKRAN